jgi:predicted Zn finger-like uncharacterized protein
VKFLCDRCKTRYSIGDERVRGKILKIRCKNCANVITVREGMAPDPDGDPARARKVTTAPEMVGEPAAASDPRETKEPRETKDARKVDVSKVSDPKVSTRTPGQADPVRSDRPRTAAPAAEPARGERVRSPQPVEPARSDAGDRARAGQPRRPGLPDEAARRQPPSAVHTGAAQASRGEPSALGAAFASAMAKPPPALDEEWYVSIDGEQAGPYSLAEAQRWVAQKPFDAELHCWSEGFDDWLPIDKVSHFRGLRKRAPSAPPPLPRAGGMAPRAALGSQAEDEPKPLFAATMASLERGAPASQGLSLPLPGAIAARTNGAVPASARPGAFADDPADAATELEAAPFADPLARRDEAARGRPAEPAPGSRDAALTSPHLPASPAPTGAGAGFPRATSPVSDAIDDFGDDDDDLAIGEVSRVVNLGDVTRKRADRPGAAQQGTPQRGAVGRSAVLGLRQGRAPSGIGVVGRPPAEPDPGPSMAPVATSHRRGLIALISVAVVLVLGVVGAVILLVTTDDEPLGGHLGTVRDIDTSRPDDPVVRPPAPASPTTVPNPLAPRPRPRVAAPTETAREGPQALGDALTSDEVEEVARRFQEPTQRCYMRSQRGVDAILIGDVKKIGVTLTIDPAGNVSDVQLSDHAANILGKCLTTMLRGWKFRPSPGGTFRFSLNFVGG